MHFSIRAIGTLIISVALLLSGCSYYKNITKCNHPVFIVSTQGNDAWTGLLPAPNRDRTDGPFATLERARDAIRALHLTGPHPTSAEVYIRGGVYERTQTFELTGEDRGVHFLTYADETVRFIGGKEIDGFKPVSSIPPALRHPALAELDSNALDCIVYVNLKERGITDFGNLTPRGFNRGSKPAALELFFQNQPMTLAEWPNGEWAKIAETPAGADGGLFAYSGDRPERWKHDSDIWLHGYWTWDWADSYVKVDSIDVWHKRIATREPYGVYGYKKGQRFRALNLLSELDSSGEWYLDRETGDLYFWPPAPIQDEKPIVSLLNTPFVSIKNASDITFWGRYPKPSPLGRERKPTIIFECARADGIVVNEGEDVLIGGCTIRNLGNSAVKFIEGKSHSIGGCEIYNVGDGGIYMSGGDRLRLDDSYHSAAFNHIHHFSRWSRTYNPAIRISGVGNRVSNNHIHDAPHAGILFSGNENLIERNEIHDVCQDTGDVGAIYMGRDWTMRGNVIRYNYIHHLLGPYTHGAMGVYLDDAASGTTIFGNVFYKASHAVFIGGGRDNLVENNIFVECDPSVHIDARGLTWAKKHIAPDGDWRMYEKLKAVNFDDPTYTDTYPKLATILDECPERPYGNVVRRNVSVDGPWLELQNVEEEWVVLENNLIDVDPRFFDRQHNNFLLRDDSPAYKMGFEKIPIREIGVCFPRKLGIF